MFKKLLYMGVAATILISSCKKDGNELPAPSVLSNVTIIPRMGAITVKWDYPKDSTTIQYVQVRYNRNGRTVTSISSIYADSVVVSGLINKLDYTFEVQPFNADRVGGKILTTLKGKPIRRPVQVVYDPENKTPISLTADMLDTYTQETTEGPKENLIDGDINTYWHTAWSDNVEPLPHWIQITFKEVTSLGGIRYYFRQNGDVNGRPNQWDLQTSDDGTTWTIVWTSKEKLPTSPVNKEQILPFDKNYKSMYFRVRIISTGAGKDADYTHLGEFAVYSIGERSTDLEAEAEKNYK
jgi:F5/8 type C domain.